MMNPIQIYIEENDPNGSISFDYYHDYCSWCERTSSKAFGYHSFLQEMSEEGYEIVTKIVNGLKVEIFKLESKDYILISRDDLMELIDKGVDIEAHLKEMLGVIA